jgi:hypothetical protein
MTLIVLGDLHQRQHEPVIVQQDGQAGVSALALESEIRFQERA